MRSPSLQSRSCLGQRRAVALLGVILVSGLGGALPLASPAPTPVSLASPVVPFVHAPVRLPDAARPASGGGYWYTQEGATLAQVNGSGSISTLTTLSLEIPVVTSPYPIGYELNGLSTSGDWYQVLVADNWGGCNTGFEMVYEIWNDADGAYAPVCDPTVTISSGDLVQLSLRFTSTSQGCLELKDLTNSQTEDDCVTQPDTGANGFQLLSFAANQNGYFTGPMTEIANPVPSTCPDYTNMPLVTYEWPKAFEVTKFIPFSDEFESGGAGTYCYTSGSTTVLIPSGSPATEYTDTASGTSYGPHYVAGQNFTYLNASFGWRLETDPKPLTSVSATPSTQTVTLGSGVHLIAAVAGGHGPYSALWWRNGAEASSGSLLWNWTAVTPGNFSIEAYGVDSTEDVVGPSATVSVRIPAILGIGAISIDTATGGADANQPITLSANPTGGLPPYQFLWSGLPPGCTPANLAALSCEAGIVGTYNVTLQVDDSNGSVVHATPLTVTVAPALTAALDGSRTFLDVNQTLYLNGTVSGGSGAFTYGWADLPDGCSSVGRATLSCQPDEPGSAVPELLVRDANGFLVNASASAVQVLADPTLSLGVSRATLDAGVPLVLTASAAGGAGGFVYVWSGLAANCSGDDGPIVTCSLDGGTYSIGVTSTDAAGYVNSVAPIVIYAFPALTATLDGPSNITLGDALSVTAHSSGGSSGVTYAWANLPPGCFRPAGANLTCTPVSAGTYTVTVIVSDAGGGSTTVQATIVVGEAAPPVGGNEGPSISIWEIAALAGAAAIVVALAVVLLRRRPSP